MKLSKPIQRLTNDVLFPPVALNLTNRKHIKLFTQSRNGEFIVVEPDFISNMPISFRYQQHTH